MTVSSCTYRNGRLKLLEEVGSRNPGWKKSEGFPKREPRTPEAGEARRAHYLRMREEDPRLRNAPGEHSHESQLPYCTFEYSHITAFRLSPLE